jgi:cyclophilin family peptidyl-prolyl cis-trans isomerase
MSCRSSNGSSKMIDRFALHDYQNSRAVLIGTSTYHNLGNVPAARSLRRLHGLLTSDLCGWPSDKITLIEEARRPGDLHYELIQAFHKVSDVALFYFVGHGLVDDEDQLCLGLVESDNRSHLRASTSLEFRDVRDGLLRSKAETRLLILDCCFAGLANQRRNTLGISELVEQAGGAGTYTMAACQAYGTASFDNDGPDPQTHFTKYLVDLIEEGIPGQPAELRLRPIFRRLSERLTADGHPRPMERNIDSASDFAFAYNAAPVQVQVDVPTALQRMDDRLSRMEGYFAALAEQAGLSGSLPGAQPGASSAWATPSEPDGAPMAAEQGGEPAQAPGVSTTSGGDQARPPDGQVTRVAALQAKAADLLRVNNGVEFRAVEAQLQELGASARPTAVLQTSMGSITIRLFPDYAPEAVRNFIELARGTRPWIDSRAPEPFRRGVRLYDGTLFHRVVRGLLIQGGDPTGTGSGGPGYRQANEFHRELTFDQPYMVAMANSGESSNGSQFFITVSVVPWLNGKHTIFGEVIDNSTVAAQISLVPVDAEDRPIEDVALESVRISGDTTGN